MHIQLVLIQATSFCNINCQYCYLPDRAIARRIKMETLERIFQRLFASSFLSNEVLFLWHAGEPLTLPRSFYEQAFELQERWNEKHIKITNAIQTNGTLITQKWCDFFRAYGIHVGVSLDGPREMHDARRRDRAGMGTFERVMRGIELLRANQIAYTLISVITSVSVQEPDVFWNFFSELQPASLGLNPEEVEGINRTSSLSTNEDVRQYQRFVGRLLELNEQRPDALSIREIERLFSLLKASTQPVVRSQTGTPIAILNFDCDGNFSTFSPELLSMKHERYGDFLFGNIFDNALEEIFDHPTFKRVHAEIQEGIKQCEKTCSYFALCGGGSPSNKLYENGTFNSTETMACRLQVKAPVDAVLEHMEKKYHLTL